jgi:hypothetical protein
MQQKLDSIVFRVDYRLDSDYFEKVEQGKNEVAQVEVFALLNRCGTT